MFPWRLQGGFHRGEDIREALLNDLNTPIDDLDSLQWSPTKVDFPVFDMDYNKDTKAWQPILEKFQEIANQRATPGWELSVHDPLCEKIKALVPWEILKIQISKTPKARRQPLDVPFRHRAAILLKADGDIVTESERIMNTSFPCLRFSSPMAMGIFIYGNAPATEEPGPPPLPTESDKAAEAEAAMDEDEELGPVHTT